MAQRRRITPRALQASRRNVRRAQLSRIGIREPRSIGRMTRSRQRTSKPTVASRARSTRRRW